MSNEIKVWVAQSDRTICVVGVRGGLYYLANQSEKGPVLGRKCHKNFLAPELQDFRSVA